MLVSKKIQQTFNRQIGREIGASLQYVAISAHFGAESLLELQALFERQANEERDHAMKFVKFLVDAGARVEVPAIPAPQNAFRSAAEAIALSVEWEKTVTQEIYELVEIAKADKNYIAQRFLDWFVTEQLEEVSSMTQLLAIVERAGEKNLLYVEDHLARRGGAAGGTEAGE